MKYEYEQWLNLFEILFPLHVWVYLGSQMSCLLGLHLFSVAASKLYDYEIRQEERDPR